MTAVDFSPCDQLYDKGEHDAAFSKLTELYEGDQQENVEVLWRLARALYFRAVVDKKKYKDLLYQGQSFAQKGHELDPENFECLRWASIITGTISDISGHKEKVQQGNLFKEYLDKALALNPEEHTLLHMSGRLCFSVASLSWVEKTLAKTLFGTPPEATMDEAIEKFLKVEEVFPNKWIENRLYLAKAFQAKGDKKQMVEYLKAAHELSPDNDADRMAHEEVKTLVKKHVK